MKDIYFPKFTDSYNTTRLLTSFELIDKESQMQNSRMKLFLKALSIQ